MKHSLLSRIAGWTITAFACVATALPGARAQTDASAPLLAMADRHETIKLDNYVVSASRTPQDPKYTPSSVTLLKPEDLAEFQITDLHTALAQTPGVTVANYGPAGSQSVVYIRGASSAQTLVIVDGIRVSSRQTDGSTGRSVMGSAGVSGLDRIEVLRGPQGTLYGSSALGGVIVMETTHGCGDFSGTVEAGAGSFASKSGAIAVQGGTATLGYSAAVGYTSSANDRPNNDYRDWNYSARVEEKLFGSLLVGMTFRGNQGDYQEAGSTKYFSPGDVDSDSYLTTAYVELANDGEIKSRLTTGWEQSDYTFIDLSGSPWASNNYFRSTRQVIDWQNTVTLSPTAAIVAGLNAEWEYFRSTSTPATLQDRSRGVYVSTDIRPVDPVTLTAGMRYDHFDSAGDATTARGGVAYRFEETGTKVRATIGTAFNAPGLTERFGDNLYYGANPALRPEKSTGWDAGFDQEVFGKALTLAATYFHNQFRNMIVGKPVAGNPPYQWQNISRARTEGVELALVAQPVETVKIRLSGTYLDAYDTTNTPVRITYKPRKSGDLDVSWQASTSWMIGTGVHYVGSRVGPGALMPEYSSVRFYTSYEVMKNLFVKVRVENAFNHYYEEISGYPSLPRGVFASIEYKF